MSASPQVAPPRSVAHPSLVAIDTTLHTGAASTRSVARATIRTACIRLLGGQSRFGVASSAPTTGGVVSCTVTVVVAVPTFPVASVALKVTVVVPAAKTAGASLETAGAVGSQLSAAVGSGTVTAVPAGPACSTVIGAGTPEKAGAVT